MNKTYSQYCDIFLYYVYDSPMIGIIGIATFSRSDLLEQCISSIVRAKGSRDIPLLVLHQLGDPEVKQVIIKWRSHIKLLIELEPFGKSALQNINLNSIFLRNIAFNTMGADWFLGIEEDVVIGGDSIAFIEDMMEKYSRNRGFRGVNLGSNIPRENFSANQYSRNRYGMLGQASAITRRTWRRFDIDRLIKNSSWNALDGMMENYLKSGFMCFPVLSRYLDKGWGGTHGFGNPNHSYYLNFENSFINLPETNSIEYIETKIRIPLREDCVLYNPITNIYHNVRNFISNLYFTKVEKTTLE